MPHMLPPRAGMSALVQKCRLARSPLSIDSAPHDAFSLRRYEPPPRRAQISPPQTFTVAASPGGPRRAPRRWDNPRRALNSRRRRALSFQKRAETRLPDPPNRWRRNSRPAFSLENRSCRPSPLAARPVDWPHHPAGSPLARAGLAALPAGLLPRTWKRLPLLRKGDPPGPIRSVGAAGRIPTTAAVGPRWSTRRRSAGSCPG